LSREDIDSFFGFPATSNNTFVQGFTGPNSTIAVPSAEDQVSAYLSGANTDSIHNNLFTILIGANDVLFNENITASETVNNVVKIINELKQKGELTCY
jgi:lysophospholipase L1-like esterase